MTLRNQKFEGVVTELREQGLKLTAHSSLNETWYVEGDGIHNAYIVSGAELLELKRAHQLDIRGIRSLG